MKNKEIGNKGEILARNFLIVNGYTIENNNWRYQHLEVDIIASKEQKLHFVEVKTRTNTTFGLPEESISKTKMGHLKRAAEAYLHFNTEWGRIQFDVIAIMLSNKREEILFIEDVFF